MACFLGIAFLIFLMSLNTMFLCDPVLLPSMVRRKMASFPFIKSLLFALRWVRYTGVPAPGPRKYLDPSASVTSTPTLRGSSQKNWLESVEKDVRYILTAKQYFFIVWICFYVKNSLNRFDTCCRHVGVSGDTALVRHALLDVGVLVHQHHGDLFPGTWPCLSGVTFTGHQMSVGRQLTGVACLAAGVQPHLEGVTLLRGERGAEDRCVCRGLIHDITEVTHSPIQTLDRWSQKGWYHPVTFLPSRALNPLWPLGRQCGISFWRLDSRGAAAKAPEGILLQHNR